MGGGGVDVFGYLFREGGRQGGREGARNKGEGVRVTVRQGKGHMNREQLAVSLATHAKLLTLSTNAPKLQRAQTKATPASSAAQMPTSQQLNMHHPL